MARLNLIVSAAVAHIVGAAPVPSEHQYINWQTEPSSRGTWSLLFGCVSTLFLCVYTAIHLNVPAPGTTLKQQNLQLAKWIFIGIFAPEIAVYSAIIQWAGARDLSRRVMIIRDEMKGDIPEWLANWTLKQSFFVKMGGLALSPTTNDPSGEGHENTARVLTGAGFLHLLRQHHTLPDLSENNISDYSKANSITKAISILQAGWLIVQLIGRRADSLTITELEINTLAHVLSALLMFLFWFHKPLRIDHPLRVSSDGLWSFYFAHSIRGGDYGRFLFDVLHESYYSDAVAITSNATVECGSNAHTSEGHSRIGSLDEQEWNRGAPSDATPAPPEHSNASVHSMDSENGRTRPSEPLGTEHDSFDVIELTEQQPSAAGRTATDEHSMASDACSGCRNARRGREPDVHYELRIYSEGDASIQELSDQIYDDLPARCGGGHLKVTVTDSENGVHSSRGRHKRSLTLSLTDLTSFLQLLRDPSRDSILDLDTDHDSSHCIACRAISRRSTKQTMWRRALDREATGKPGVHYRAKNWYTPSALLGIRKIMAVSLATVFYGAVHAAAWNSHFPSVVEMWLWRVSSIMAGLFCIVPLFAALVVVGDLIFPGLGTLLIGGPGFLVAVLAFVAYCFTRVFLVVEAFISLRSQPADVYRQPNWLGLLPHL